MGTLLNQAQLDASQISFSTRFAMALEAIDDPVRQIAMELPSSAAVEEYDWLGSTPGLSEWLDDRKLSSLRAEGFQIRNKDWASGLVVNRNDILDDRLGIVGPRIASLAQKAGLHYGNLVADYLKAGFGTTLGTAYDGVAMFSASHKDGDGPTQSNTGTGVLNAANYDAARAVMQELTDEESDHLGIRPTHLLVGPSLERTALEVTQAGVIANSAGTASITNVFAGTASVIVTPKLSGAAANYWFLLDLSTELRPMILQIREPITFAAQDSMTDDAAFMRKVYKYGAQARHAVGYGLWQKVWGSDGTV